MKITGTSLLPVQTDKNKTKYQISFCSKHNKNKNKSTIEQSTSLPDFENISSEQSKKILSNPVLLQGFSNFISNGLTKAYLKLIEIAGGANDEVHQFENICEQQTETLKQNEPFQKIEQLETEIEQLKQENKSLLEKLNEALASLAAKKNSDYENVSNFQIYEGKLVKVAFPKRRGSLSKELMQLKLAVESANIPENSAEELISVCKVFLLKGADKKDIINFNYELSENKNNPAKISEIISKFYQRCKTEYANVAEIFDKNTNVEQTFEEPNKVQENENVFETEIEKIRKGKSSPKGFVVLGKIDIDPVDERKRREKIEKAKRKKAGLDSKNLGKIFPSKEEIKKLQRTGAKVQNDISLSEQRKKIDCYYVDRASKFYYELPPENERLYSSNDTCGELGEVIKDFKKVINPGYKNGVMSWLKRPVLKNDISENQIKAAIKQIKIRAPKYQKGDLTEHLLNNISEENALVFVDIINNPKFKGLFTLHSALRLIDRFGDFSNGNPSEEQCEELVDCLKDTIHRALENGVNYEEYLDKYSQKGKPHHGICLIIQPEYFDKKAKRFFGTYPLVLSLCEQQKGKDKLGAIATIYSDKDCKYRRIVKFSEKA